MTVLVTTASRHGSTAEIGDEIARVLAERGVDCRVVPAADASPEDADAVVLGSGVYIGRWLDDARRFAARHGASLAGRPVWIFSSGPIGTPPKPDAAHAVDVREILGATAVRRHALFAGKVDRSQLGPLERTIVRAVGAPDGDYRDWAAVRAYANEIADELVTN